MATATRSKNYPRKKPPTEPRLANGPGPTRAAPRTTAPRQEQRQERTGGGGGSAGSFNSATVVGNLGADPEVRFTQSGQAVCSFSVATSERWKAADGTQNERTEWHRIVAWGKLAEVCGEYLAKGKKALVQGRLQTREWEDKEGIRRFTTEIVANTVTFLSPADGARRAQREQAEDNAPTEEDVPF